MIRPWYRSRLFWFGLSGLLFLLGCWLASANSILMWRWSRMYPVAEVVVAHGGGRLSGSTVMIEDFTPAGASVPKFPWIFETYGPALPMTLDGKPSPLFLWPPVAMESQDPTRRSVSMTHWFIVLLYSVTWCGVLCSWQRRKSRLLKPSVAPQP